jgi:hypothetical protein
MRLITVPRSRHLFWRAGYQLRLTRADVLRPHSDPDQPCREAAQRRKPIEQLYGERRLRPFGSGEHAADHAVLDDELNSLCHPGRPFAAGLHAGEVVEPQGAGASGSARMLAAATASWTARLMPTAPIGDIA